MQGPLFDNVEFVELDREEAEKLVEQYNKEGRLALPPPDKRYRHDDRGGFDRGECSFGLCDSVSRKHLSPTGTLDVRGSRVILALCS